MTDVHSQPGYETSDAPPWLLATLAGGLAATVALVLASLAIAFPHATKGGHRGPTAPLPPAPQLQTDPYRDQALYSTSQQQKLGGYGWSGDGHVTVPVDRAMREVATEGWGEPK